MGTNTVFFGWARSNPGREHLSNQHFEEFVKYLNGQKQAKAIDDYEIVFLDVHGGDLGGFFLIKAESPKLDRHGMEMRRVSPCAGIGQKSPLSNVLEDDGRPFRGGERIRDFER